MATGLSTSWPGLFRPSTSLEPVTKQGVDAWDKPGHDEEARYSYRMGLHQLIVDPDRRRRGFAGRASGSGSLSAPMRRNAASAARSPLSHAPSIVPHSVSCVASPARYMQPTGSVRTFRDACPPGPADDIAPSANGAAFQRVALDFFTAAAASLPNNLVSHSTANATMAFS